MAEIRETLRFTSNDLEEMNRVMGRLQDRIDALEGFRGDPRFIANVDLDGNRIINTGRSVNSNDVVIKQELDEFGPVLIAPSITSYTPYTVSIFAGTHISGTIESIENLGDGSLYTVQEAAATPGYFIQFDFKDIPGFHAIAVRCDYKGSSTHLVGLDLWKDSTGTWDQITLIDASDVLFRYLSIYGIKDDNYITNDNVKLRFYHYSGGNASHYIFLDYIALLRYIV